MKACLRFLFCIAFIRLIGLKAAAINGTNTIASTEKPHETPQKGSSTPDYTTSTTTTIKNDETPSTYTAIEKETIVQLSAMQDTNEIEKCNSTSQEFFVTIIKKVNNEILNTCAGVLIGKLHVVTSSTCCQILNKQDYFVELDNGSLIKLKSYFSHSDYFIINYDICLITLAESVPYDLFPTIADEGEQPHCDKTDVLAVSKISSTAQCAVMSMADINDCKNVTSFELDEEPEVFCAKSDSRVCHLMEGSPYVCQDNVLHGVMLGNGTKHARLFAKVGHFKPILEYFLFSRLE